MMLQLIVDNALSPAAFLVYGVCLALWGVRSLTTRLRLGVALIAIGLTGAAVPSVVGVPVALTNASLLKLPASSLLPMPVVRFGVNAIGDAPPSWWWQQSGTCASNSMVSNVGSCNDASDGNSFSAIIPPEGLDVRQFGAKFDGVTNDTTAVQAALNWVPSGGGSLVFPYKITVVGALTGNGNPVQLVFNNTTIVTNQSAAAALTFAQSSVQNVVKTRGNITFLSSASAATPGCFFVSFPSVASYDAGPDLDLDPINCISTDVTTTAPYPGTFSEGIKITNGWYPVVRHPWITGPATGSSSIYAAGSVGIELASTSDANGINGAPTIDDALINKMETGIWQSGYAEGVVINNLTTVSGKWGYRVGARTFDASGTPSGSSGITARGGFNGQLLDFNSGTISATVAPIQIDSYQFLNVNKTQFYNVAADGTLPYRGGIIYATVMGQVEPIVEGNAANLTNSIGLQLAGATEDLNLFPTIAGVATGLSATAATSHNNADLTIGSVASVATPISDGGTGNGFMFNKGQNWITYSPTLSCGSGTLTSGSATGRYKQLGKTIFFQQNITITTNGSCATFLGASVPVTGDGNGSFSGIGIVGTHQGYNAFLDTTPNKIDIFSSSGIYGFNDGFVVFMSGTYQIP